MFTIVNIGHFEQTEKNVIITGICLNIVGLKLHVVSWTPRGTNNSNNNYCPTENEMQ